MVYFFDTYALIEIVKGNKDYQKYALHEGATLKENLAELFYFLLREYNEKTAFFFFEKFSRLAVDIPLEVIPRAMLFRLQRVKVKFSYTDCLGYGYARSKNLIFLTGDRAFQGLEKVEIVR